MHEHGEKMKKKVVSRSFVLDGESFQYSLHRRTGQKHIHLRITKEGDLRVSVPMHAPLPHIEEVIRKKSKWLKKNFQKVQDAAERYDPLRRIPLHGEWHQVVFTPSNLKGTVRLDEQGRRLFILSRDSDTVHLSSVLKRYCKNQARKLFVEKLTLWSGKLGIPYDSVSVRDQKTRWGSSSGKGHISLNWRIICTPPLVQDYLMVHELMHQRHHNHAAAFWKAVEKAFPRARECDLWLKQHDMIMSILR